jgi:hypothetical protein
VRFTSWHRCTQCGFEGFPEQFIFDREEVIVETPVCLDDKECLHRWIAGHKAKQIAKRSLA